MTFVAPNLACGEARGGRIPGHGAVTDEQQSHRPNSAQPGGRQVFFAQTSLLAPYRSTAGYARRSRLVWAKNPLPRTSSCLCLRPLSRNFIRALLAAVVYTGTIHEFTALAAPTTRSQIRFLSRETVFLLWRLRLLPAG